jgi:polyisoprenyl-phosphate glycosyltransferase
MKKVSIITPCFNESKNVDELCLRIKNVMLKLSQYDYEHIFIDNASNDNTVKKIKEKIRHDKKIKLIVNARNYGHIRSPYHALIQTNSDAAILLSSDLQDPPELIPDLILEWERGMFTVLTVKSKTKDSFLMGCVRKFYYKFLASISEVEIVQNATGSGLFDRRIIDIFKDIQNPYPYIRGLVCEIGLPIGFVFYDQPMRKSGITKNNFLTLYDMAMNGITSHSKIPLRLISLAGFLLSIFSFLIALSYLIYKLFFWDSFSVGSGPVIIGLFFISGIQLIFLGVIGEYVSATHVQVKKTPKVIEKERVNFK